MMRLLPPLFALALAAPILWLGLMEQKPETTSVSTPQFVKVTLTSGKELLVSRFEVTVEQWNACVSAKHCDNIAKLCTINRQHPVTVVNWFDVENYLAWVNRQTGSGYRLPTHDEWLAFAADHSPEPKQKLFDDPRLAWAADYDINAGPVDRKTKSVGFHGKNGKGVFDIRGNVWEWTSTDCSSLDSRFLSNCRSGRIAMGEHVAVLSEFVRDPGNASCGAGLSPANLGFRLVSDIAPG